jgi:hypothetical protein
VHPSFTDGGRIIALLRELARDRRFDAVAVARGGGDQSLGLWNDPAVAEALLALGKPFYTALGHSVHEHSADALADESFITPTAFGAAVGREVAARDRPWQPAQEPAPHRALSFPPEPAYLPLLKGAVAVLAVMVIILLALLLAR